MTTPKDIYARKVVMARVGHLIRRKQQEVERITHIHHDFINAHMAGRDIVSLSRHFSCAKIGVGLRGIAFDQRCKV